MSIINLLSEISTCLKMLWYKQLLIYIICLLFFIIPGLFFFYLFFSFGRFKNLFKQTWYKIFSIIFLICFIISLIFYGGDFLGLIFYNFAFCGFISLSIFIFYSIYHIYKKIFDKRFYITSFILLLMFILSFPNIIFFFNDLKVSNLSNKNITLALKNEIFASKFSIIPQFKYFMNVSINFNRFADIIYVDLDKKYYKQKIGYKEFGGYKVFLDETIKTQEYLCRKDKNNCSPLIQLYLYNNDLDKVIKNTDNYIKLFKYKSSVKTDFTYSVKYYKFLAYILKGEYEKAFDYADTFENERNKFINKAVCLTYLKRYDEALDVVKGLNGDRDSVIKGFIYKRRGDNNKLKEQYKIYITEKYMSNLKYSDYIRSVNTYEFENIKNIQKLIDYKKQHE